MDIATVWDPDAGRADWRLADGDLQGGDDLVTAVLISLLTDRRADPDDVIPDGSGDPRGWPGDHGADFPIGSKLWLYRRRKRTMATLQLIRAACDQALAWMTATGVASRVEVLAEWQDTEPRPLIVTITIHRAAGGPPIELQFAFAWEEA